jgi:2-polyprenyl-6-hydroxyphenyl methylase/3-demethylubiquinone-9 3-methyltransferase
MDTADMTQLSTHFKFGANWETYSRHISEDEIRQASNDLARLVGGDLNNKTFLDIGCGSGLHALAALQLGAENVTAIDIDPISIRTTETTLNKFAPERNWSSQQMSSIQSFRRSLNMTWSTVGEFSIIRVACGEQFS